VTTAIASSDRNNIISAPCREYTHLILLLLLLFISFYTVSLSLSLCLSCLPFCETRNMYIKFSLLLFFPPRFVFRHTRRPPSDPTCYYSFVYIMIIITILYRYIYAIRSELQRFVCSFERLLLHTHRSRLHFRNNIISRSYDSHVWMVCGVCRPRDR